MSKFKYTYLITRYGELETTIETDTFINTEESIMSFYQQKISEKDRDRIIKAYSEGKITDTFGYIQNYINSKSQSFAYWEIMGDLQFFEGLKKIGNNHYFVALGS